MRRRGRQQMLAHLSLSAALFGWYRVLLPPNGVFVGTERFVRFNLVFAAAVLSAAVLAQPAHAQGAISAGQTVSGRLDASDYLRDDGTYYDDWFYEGRARSEEHTSELQSRLHLVCRLLLEK